MANPSKKPPLKPELYMAIYGDRGFSGEYWALANSPQDAADRLIFNFDLELNEEVAFYKVCEIQVERKVTIVEKK